MKNLILKTGLVSIVLLLASIYYLNSSHYILNHDWKYADGTTIGDWLEKNNFEIKDGLIYGTSGKAKIVFCFGFKLLIKDLKTKEKGFYVRKD